MINQPIARNMEVVDTDGVHLGTVEAVVDERVKLSKRDSVEGSHAGHNQILISD